ncbi:hypothetical protein CANTEDRAFT_112586 [Yamadazyma tenuis ATCC 10573]|uniref:Uncharacterized protein n=3 Tax=Candida tenuis TaxID=2315449 RepID=G3AXY1_CANTC|nr:uncharacterized protein CANTEDRAFT_112586 [Yamadazyma tenuis ATCC 10573]EGV65722.1 hypothetical protein CANTEDRAFT_112586 [Yamadazyma tenuis ATCC 10573]
MSGSTKFFGGKLFIKYFEFKSKQAVDSFYYSGSTLDLRSKFSSLTQILAVSSFILFVIIDVFPAWVYGSLDILAKTIIAAELIGSSTSNLTVVSSSNSHATQQQQNNGTPYYTSPSSNTQGQTSKPHTNQILNNDYLKVLSYFLLVVSLDSLQQRLDFQLILKCFSQLDFEPLISTKVFHSYLRRPQSSFFTGRFPDISKIVSSATPSPKLLGILLKYFYYELCINVIIVKFEPIFSIIGLKRISNNFDHLNNLNPNIPIRNKNFKEDPILISKTNSIVDFPSIPVISLKSTELNNKLVDVPIKRYVTDSKINFQKTNSISGKNFEIFVLKTFTNKKVSSTSNNIRVNKNSNSTLIIDKSVSIIQPVWSLLAVLKILFKNSNLFQGKPNDQNESHYELDSSLSRPNKLLLAPEYIDSSRVLFRSINAESKIPTNIKIDLNDLEWDYFKVYGNFLLIYALSPLSQFEITISNSKEETIANLLISTPSDEKSIIRESKSLSSVETLKLSLKSTLKSLEKMKIELKEFKKEENKRQGEAKKNNELLLEKISKTSNHDEQNLKKIKILKQSVKQFEIDIANLEDEIKQASQVDLDLNDSALWKDIESLQDEISKHEGLIEEINCRLKETEEMKVQNSQKLDKLVLKAYDISSEAESHLEEVDSFRTGVLKKLGRKIARFNEGFDSIIPHIQADYSELSKSLDALKKSHGITMNSQN